MRGIRMGGAMKPRVIAASLLLGATATLGAATPQSATVVTDGDVATGILGLQIGGLTYDVTFPVTSSASTYGNPPKFDFKSNAEANSAATAVVAVLNAERGVLGVGTSGSNGRPIFRVPWGLEELHIPVVDIDVELLKVWEGVTGYESSSPGVWGVPTDSDLFPFGDDGAFAKFELVNDGPPSNGNSPPVADPGGDYSAGVGEAVKFDGSDSYDPDGKIDSYEWDFGDDSTGKGKKPKHTYGEAGKFNVRLTVTDDKGTPASATTKAQIGQGGQRPTADAGGPYSGSVDKSVKFDGSESTDPENDISDYSWDFGDGSSTKKGKKPKHTYEESGTFSVTLEVTNKNGDTDTDVTSAEIADGGNLPPKADAGGPYQGKVDKTVKFDGTGSSDPDGQIEDYEWDFGDGSRTEKGKTARHEYEQAGTYTVTLTVTDEDGVKDTHGTTAVISQ
jgi:PKD repeat protein